MVTTTPIGVKLQTYASMEMTVFTIFVPDRRKFYLSLNWIVAIAWGIALILVWSLNWFTGKYSSIIGALVCLFLATLVLKIVRRYIFDPLRGKFDGKISFGDEGITVDGKRFNLRTLKSLDFDLSDFYGRKKFAYGRDDFNPLLSRGVGNWVIFTDDLQETHTIYFKLPDDMCYRGLADFISEAARQGKMTQSRVTELLGTDHAFAD